MNLIEQQNILRGMPDDALKQAIMTQSSVPPYLVLTEIQRRKNARDRYMQMSQKQDAANTVAEELMGGRMPEMAAPAAAPGIEAAMGMAMPPAAPAGLEAAMPPQNFADGGQVGYADGQQVTLQDILAKLSNYGVDQEKAKQDAITMAMLQASAAMLNNGSSNTFKNIGAGLGAAAPAYQSAMDAARKDDMALLSAQANVLGDISSAGRQAEELKLRQQEIANTLAYQQGMLENAATPEDAQRIEWAKANLPPDKQEAFILQPKITEAQKQYQIILAQYSNDLISDMDRMSPEKLAAAQARVEAAAADFIKYNFGADVLKYIPGASDTFVDLTGTGQ